MSINMHPGDKIDISIVKLKHMGWLITVSVVGEESNRLIENKRTLVRFISDLIGE